MKLKKFVLIPLAASCLIFSPEIYNSDSISVVQAEVKMYTGTGESQMSEVEKIDMVKLRAREKAVKSATEKAGVALISYSRILNNVLTDDEILTITNTKYEMVGEPSYERLIKQITDLTAAVIWKATVNVNVDDEEVKNWFKLDDETKADLIAQTKNNFKLLDENNKRADNLREQYLNAKTDAEKFRIQAELEKTDKEFLEILAVKKFRQAESIKYSDKYAAEAIYTEAIEFFPEYALAYFYRGRLYHYDLNDDTNALADFTKVIELEPENFEAYKERAMVYYSMENYNEDYNFHKLAIQDFNKAIELKPNDADSYWLRGHTYRLLKELEKAVEDLSEAIKISPNDTFSYLYYEDRGEIYLQLKDYKNAVKDLTMAIKLEPTTYSRYISRAKAYENLGEYKKAVEDYTTAIGISPDTKHLYSDRAAIYEKLGETEKAKADMAKSNSSEERVYSIDELTKMIESNPQNAEMYLKRGNLYRKSKNYNAALSDFNKAVELNPKNADAYNGRGRVYYNQENYEAAMKDFNQAVKINSQFADAYCNRGLVWHKLRKYEKAVADFTKAIEINPANKKFYRCRANSYLHLNENEKYAADLAKI